MNIPFDPRATILIQRVGMTDGQADVRYDSVESPRLIKSVDVELVTNESSQAEISFFDPKHKVIDAFSDATTKAVIKVYLGYGQDLGEPIFKGLLAQLEHGQEKTTFIAFDMAYVMKLEKKTGYKNKKGDLAIIQGLVERNKLKFEGPDKPKDLEAHKAMMADQQTDWDWMMERARDSGLVIFVRHDTVFAKYPATVGTPALTLEYGKDFTILAGMDFRYRTLENQDGKPQTVKVRRRGKGGKRAEGEAQNAVGAGVQMVLKRDSPSPTKSKLTRRAQAQRELEREHAFEGSITTVVQPNGSRLDVRNTVKLTGMDKFFSGDYISDGVFYRFAPGQLSMELDLYRDIKTQ